MPYLMQYKEGYTKSDISFEAARTLVDTVCVDSLGVCDKVLWSTRVGHDAGTDRLMVTILWDGAIMHDFMIGGLNDDQSGELHVMVAALNKMTREMIRSQQLAA